VPSFPALTRPVEGCRSAVIEFATWLPNRVEGSRRRRTETVLGSLGVGRLDFDPLRLSKSNSHGPPSRDVRHRAIEDSFSALGIICPRLRRASPPIPGVDMKAINSKVPGNF
jgi:hypothetical protein